MNKSEEKVFLSLFEKLRYHNQFILGPTFLNDIQLWNKVKINNSLCLSVHPDLNVYQSVRSGKSLTLVGFILDPDNPDAFDIDIIDTLILKFTDVNGLIKQTYKYGGRWVLIADDGEEIILLNDAAGLRQVFYSDVRHTKDLWCASQPGVLSELLGLEMDSLTIDFVDSYEFRTHKEYRWPAESSPYREIRHMLPNHYLDLKRGICRRYWPDKPLTYLSLHEAVETVSKKILGLIQGACNRFDLAISVTAGLDSRIVLASSKDIRDRVSYMTVRQIGMPDDHADITTPSRMLLSLGLKHHIVKSSFVMMDEFVRIFKKNVPFAHDIYLPDAHAIWRYYSQSKVAVTGGASEIARSSFRDKLNKPKDEKITPYDLSKLQKMGKNQFVLRAFDNWLSDLGDVNNIDVLDLFEWEQGHGNWLAMCYLEFDTAWKDIFTPFNCRDLLITMLSVEEKYRKPPNYELYKRLISNLWPDVLIVPINPHKSKNKSSGSILISRMRTMMSRYTPDSIKRLRGVFR